MKSKLVRNLIPKIIAEDAGRAPLFYAADDEEYLRRLKEKLQEEVQEFIESEDMREMADILEVIEAILIFKNISVRELEYIKENKAALHGTFSERIILSGIKKACD